MTAGILDSMDDSDASEDSGGIMSSRVVLNLKGKEVTPAPVENADSKTMKYFPGPTLTYMAHWQ